VDLANYVGPSAQQPSSLPQAEVGGFYRKTPNAKVASGGGGGRLDLDVPAFLRKQGGGGNSD
jgi:hypothetical protein